jgi:hypothetical protein
VLKVLDSWNTLLLDRKKLLELLALSFCTNFEGVKPANELPYERNVVYFGVSKASLLSDSRIILLNYFNKFNN